jgi:hypothetical protein
MLPLLSPASPGGREQGKPLATKAVADPDKQQDLRTMMRKAQGMKASLAKLAGARRSTSTKR